MFLTIILLALMLTGLVLVASGIVVLLKSNNKFAGWVVLAVGVVFSLFSGGVFLFLTITTSVGGGM
jgi:hypothetical protein